jgi:hypothetical protein
MSAFQDGPRSAHFFPLVLQGNAALASLDTSLLSAEMVSALSAAPEGSCTGWGIPFEVDRLALLAKEPVSMALGPVNARWLIFMHTSDYVPTLIGSSSLASPGKGPGKDREIAATYTIAYEDGSQVSVPICRRFQIGPFQRTWGNPCYEAVAFQKPHAVRAHHEQPAKDWGFSQTRVDPADSGLFTNWLWAWENPHPEKAITGLDFRPGNGVVIVSAVSYGNTRTSPLRWQTRRKAMLTLPAGEKFKPELDAAGRLSQIQLDLGQVISAQPQPGYPNADWEHTYDNQLPVISEEHVLVEYTAHPEACFHLSAGQTLTVEELEAAASGNALQPVKPAVQRVTLRAVEKGSGKLAAVKLHVHGEFGEYLQPVDRHRIINPAWYEDYSADFAHQFKHYCTYIPGETRIDLPLGKVYVEISKGFEIRPVRRVYEITPETRELTV